VSSVPEQIVTIGKLMFERRLADIAGGNISVRQGNTIYITPTGAGQKWHWCLDPRDILSAPVDTDELMAHPRHSKESISHLLVYRALPEVNAIIHSHPFHVMPFAATGTPIRPLTMAAEKHGEIGFIPDAPVYSREQGELFIAHLTPQRELIARTAAAVMMPRHGIFVVGKDLYTAIDCLERIDNSAYCNLAVKLIR
jgi:L-fuculose-phosphate aldolase